MLEALGAAVDRFNLEGTNLQTSEFRRPQSPSEWQRMHAARHSRDYAKIFDPVLPLLAAFEAAVPDDRIKAAIRLNEDAVFTLWTFAAAMPVLAVRRQTPGLIRQGLLAQTIAGDAGDFRDVMFTIAALYHAGAKLGVDSATIFTEAAAFAPPGYLQREIRSFPGRSPNDRRLAAFWLYETLTDGEFDILEKPRDMPSWLLLRPFRSLNRSQLVHRLFRFFQ